jgi:hypothetical protein
MKDKMLIAYQPPVKNQFTETVSTQNSCYAETVSEWGIATCENKV